MRLSRRFWAVAGTLAVGILPAGCGSPQSGAEPCDFTPALQDFRVRIDEGQSRGGGMIIGRPGEIVWERYVAGFGPDDVEDRWPFGIFVGFTILRLVEAGILVLDQPLKEYGIDIPEVYAELTLRQTLTHTAGLPGLGTVCSDAESFDLKECVFNLADRGLSGSSGFTVSSSRPLSTRGTTVSMYVAQAVVGEPWEQVLQEWTAEPLGLGPGVAEFGPITIHDLRKLAEALAREDPALLSPALWSELKAPKNDGANTGLEVHIRRDKETRDPIGYFAGVNNSFVWVDSRTRSYGVNLAKSASTSGLSLGPHYEATGQLDECLSP